MKTTNSVDNILQTTQKHTFKLAERNAKNQENKKWR